MIYHLGLLDGQKRYQDQRFMRVWCNFEAGWLSRADSWELAVILATPGFAYEHHCWAFAWSSVTRHIEVPRLIRYWSGDESVEQAARANAASITAQDGIDYLEAMLETKRGYGGSVPLWATLALQDRRARGQTARELADEFRTTSARVAAWWSENRFDPLTGAELPV